MSDEALNAGAEAPVNDTAPAPADAPAQASNDTGGEKGADLRGELEAAYNKAYERPRDEHGRFLKLDEDVPQDGVAVKALEESGDEPPVESDQPDEAAVEPETPAIDPPHSWSREAREGWSKLPPETQQYIAQRESEAHSQITRLGQQLQSFMPLAQVLESHEQAFQARGIDAVEGVARILDVQRQLDFDPYGTIQKIAQAYGADLSVFGKQQQPQYAENGEVSAQPDPRLSIALQQNQALQDRINRLEQGFSVAQQRELEAQQQQVANEIDAFLAERPIAPELLDDVAGYVGYLSQTKPHLSPRDRLNEAYKRIVESNPDVTAERVRKEMAEESRKKATEAKRAATLNVKSSPAAPAAKRFNSLREELEYAYENRVAS